MCQGVGVRKLDGKLEKFRKANGIQILMLTNSWVECKDWSRDEKSMLVTLHFQVKKKRYINLNFLTFSNFPSSFRNLIPGHIKISTFLNPTANIYKSEFSNFL